MGYLFGLVTCPEVYWNESVVLLLREMASRVLKQRAINMSSNFRHLNKYPRCTGTAVAFFWLVCEVDRITSTSADFLIFSGCCQSCEMHGWTLKENSSGIIYILEILKKPQLAQCAST